MYSRRIATVALLALLTSAFGVSPASAAKPTKPTDPPPLISEPPLTPEEQAASDAKIAAANAYIASEQARDASLVTLACVTPTGGADASTQAAIPGETIQGCYVPQGILPVEARDQINGAFCGPAVGQVISNYSWAMGAGRNRYSQQQIGVWMNTANGGTSVASMAAGLERATQGSPRRPAVWQWVVSPLSDSNRDGTAGGELHSFVRSNVSGSRMPLALSVKPHDPNSHYYLVSWPRPVWSPGHWIAAYGWVGLWNGTDYARLYYTDSSRDEGGSTGRYWDPMRHIAALIMEHTQRFVW